MTKSGLLPLRMVKMQRDECIVIWDAENNLFCTVDNSVRINGDLKAELVVKACNSYAALKAAAEKFVDKVESGRARSVETYSEMKAALALAEKAEGVE